MMCRAHRVTYTVAGGHGLAAGDLLRPAGRQAGRVTWIVESVDSRSTATIRRLTWCDRIALRLRAWRKAIARAFRLRARLEAARSFFRNFREG